MVCVQCQQQAYDWRRNFQKTANAVVLQERTARLADDTLTASERSEHGVNRWLKHAMLAGGEAMWGDPDIRVPGNARKQLQSKYVLQVVAYHLASTIGSVMPDSEEQYPVGALALAAAAVQRAFEWYLHDQPRGIKQGHFSTANVAGLTSYWRNSAVAELLDTPHRFDRLLESATLLIDAASVRTKPCRSQIAAASMYTRERSSSPAPPM
ncbi:hypothetical protein C2E23DRAFT_740202 [Lenzites betulinus]|nr:hypothetical protein C2E23DRAFT_745145 [Lenzites betulinus]KAH9848079.1 hypothetical protein C2E23DRAFT_740202 [Lenzites betulinus]